MKKIIFLFLFLSFGIANAQIKIHWELILPDGFLDWNKELNKNIQLYAKEKIFEITYKSPNEFIKDSSRVFFNAQGLIEKERLVDDYSQWKFFAERNIIRVSSPFIICRDFEYTHNNKIKKITYFSTVDDSMKIFIPNYQYILSYRNDSTIDNVVVADSIGNNIGKIELKYKNGKIYKERSFYNGKLLYEIVHEYITDSIGGKDKSIIIEKIYFNKILIKKLIYYSGNRILKVTLDENGTKEQFFIPMDWTTKTQISKTIYYKSKSIDYVFRVYGLDIDGKYITDTDIIKTESGFVRRGFMYKKIYNEKGLLIKEIQSGEVGKPNSEKEETYIEYKYRFRR